MMAIDPPRRITRLELERRVTKPGWFASRLGKLPACAMTLEQVTESLDAFQVRRIRWAAAELDRGDFPVVPWRLRRLAGIRTGRSPVVEAAVDEMARRE